MSLAACDQPAPPQDGFRTGGDDTGPIKEIILAERDKKPPLPPPACDKPADFSLPECQKPESWRQQERPSTGGSGGGHSSFVWIHTSSNVYSTHYVPTAYRPAPVTVTRYVSAPVRSAYAPPAPAYRAPTYSTTPSPAAYRAPSYTTTPSRAASRAMTVPSTSTTVSRGGFGATGASIASSSSS